MGRPGERRGRKARRPRSTDVSFQAHHLLRDARESALPPTFRARRPLSPLPGSERSPG